MTASPSSTASSGGDACEPVAPADDVVVVPGASAETDRMRLARLRQVRRAAAMVTVAAGIAVLTLRARGAIELTYPILLPSLGGLLAWGAVLMHTLRLCSGRLDAHVVATRLDAVQRAIEQSGPARRANEATGFHDKPETWYANQEVAELLSVAVDLRRALVVIGGRVERALVAGEVAAVSGAVSLGVALSSSVMMIWNR